MDCGRVFLKVGGVLGFPSLGVLGEVRRVSSSSSKRIIGLLFP